MSTRRIKKSKRNTRKNRLKPNIIDINGYSILLLPISNSKVIKVEGLLFGGPIVEKKNNAGISHLLEHVILNGVWKKCKKKHCSFFWEKYGTFSNALTEDTYLHFWKQGLSIHKELIVDYIISSIVNPIFNKHIIDIESNAVRNELNSYINEPSWKLWDIVYKHMYNTEGLQYSRDFKHQLKVLPTLNKDILSTFYKEQFSRERILFVITGGFEKRNMIKLLHTKLNIQRTIDKPIHVNTCFTNKKKVLYVQNKEAENTDIKLFFPVSIYIGGKDYPYLHTLSEIVGGDFSSILMTELRIKQELVYGSDCIFDTNYCGSYFVIEISTLDKNILKVLHTVFRIINKYKVTKIPKSKLENVKNKNVVEHYENNLNNTDELSSFFKFQYLFQLHKENKYIYSYNEYMNIIKNTSLKKIQSLFNTIFNTNHCIVSYIGKTKVKFTEKDY